MNTVLIETAFAETLNPCMIGLLSFRLVRWCNNWNSSDTYSAESPEVVRIDVAVHVIERQVFVCT